MKKILFIFLFISANLMVAKESSTILQEPELLIIQKADTVKLDSTNIKELVKNE